MHRPRQRLWIGICRQQTCHHHDAIPFGRLREQDFCRKVFPFFHFFVILGFESLHPFGRPMRLWKMIREVSKCDVSLFQVRPLQMSRTAFSLMTYSLAISAADDVGEVFLI